MDKRFTIILFFTFLFSMMKAEVRDFDFLPEPDTIYIYQYDTIYEYDTVRIGRPIHAIPKEQLPQIQQIQSPSLFDSLFGIKHKKINDSLSKKDRPLNFFISPRIGYNNWSMNIPDFYSTYPKIQKEYTGRYSKPKGFAFGMSLGYRKKQHSLTLEIENSYMNYDVTYIYKGNTPEYDTLVDQKIKVSFLNLGLAYMYHIEHKKLKFGGGVGLYSSFPSLNLMLEKENSSPYQQYYSIRNLLFFSNINFLLSYKIQKKLEPFVCIRNTFYFSDLYKDVPYKNRPSGTQIGLGLKILF